VERMEDSSCDVLHFGMQCIAENGLEPTAAQAMESTTNSNSPRLEGANIARAIFSEACGYGLDWRTTQRLYATQLAKRAFAGMIKERLNRAEDAYETFALVSLARAHESADDVVALRYHFGRGVTGTGLESLKVFEEACTNFAACVGASIAWADAWDNPAAEECVRGLRYQCGVILANEWVGRLSEQDKPRGAELMGDTLGYSEAAAQIFRIVRDRAYEALSHNSEMADQESVCAWIGYAEKLAGADTQANRDAHLARFRGAAQSHLNDLEQRHKLARYNEQSIRIFVSAHKPVDTFDSDILQPVQVGACKAGCRFPNFLQDDAGENISELNPMYCELTTQYWAWKNADAQYYGFCHYRRYFDFADKRHQENAYGEIMDARIDASTQAKYCLTDEQISAAVEGWDVITTEVKDLEKFPGKLNTPHEQYAAAPYLKIADLDLVTAILKEMHPDYAQDADAFLNGHNSCFCNMFIMKRDIFHEYCAWLFPILEEFCRRADMSHYSREATRTPGHLSERLLNIYLLHAQRTGRNWKRKQVQCVHFTNPEPREGLSPLPTPDPWKPVIPVVFAADNNYVPMLTTTIHSMLSNASSRYMYDVVVLHNGITKYNQGIMQEFLQSGGKASVRFVDVDPYVRTHKLSTNNAHIGVETYYRFLIQEVMPWYDKVLYLDSDLAILGDVSKLYQMDLGDNLLAGAHDIDFLGNLNMNNGERLKYNKNILHMADPYGYFQAGVLLLNTAEMRKLHSVDEWLQLAGNTKLIYNDQDVLNVACEGRVTYLDWSWNVMHDCGGRVKKVFSFAPTDALAGYEASRKAPRIIHYAGFEKPWKFPKCDFAARYWRYARETPFYEVFLAALSGVGDAPDADRMPAKALSETNPIRRIVDPICPLGSRRRETLKAIGRAIRGRQ
jgi:lipopolysaccharide biosynthesis glycosyltransferase